MDSADIPSTPHEELDPSTQPQLSPNDVQHLQTLRFRLAHLRRVEMDLKIKLGAGTEEVTSMDELPDNASNENYPYEAPDSRYLVRISRKNRRKRVQGEEMVVRGLRWREFLSHGRNASLVGRPRTSFDMQEDPADRSVSDILVACREDMKSLWKTPVVRTILKKRRVEMENNAGL